VSGGSPCACGQAACGCCEGVRALTPLPTANRPGLGELSVRIGTHGSFLATMKARLSTHALGDGPAAARPLAALGVRDSDASIALLDAFATMADVLTFYQERIVNEGYLGTATEMRSVHELARLVGYQTRPGVAASARLAFTLDSNVTEEVTIAAGSQVRTVPGPGELPQIFETSEDLVARSEWNRLGVRQVEPPSWKAGDEPQRRTLYLAGTSSRLRAGEPILVALGDARPRPYRLVEIEAEPDLDRTRIVLLPWGAPAVESTLTAELKTLRAKAPVGMISTLVVNDLDRLDQSFLGGEERWQRIDAVRTSVRAMHDGASSGATILKAWLLDVDRALNRMIEARLGPLPPDDCSFETAIAGLTKPPSAPPASALHLGGPIQDRFLKAGDAALDMLASASPDLRDHLAEAMSGCRAPTPVVPVRLWALRVRANLFGHNFPKRRRIVPTIDAAGRQASTETVEIGEWPIVTWNENDFLYRERPNLLWLDSGYDEIAPGSWLFIDSSAALRSDAERARVPNLAVEPAQPWLVTRANAVQAGLTRTEYGGSGASSRIAIDPGDGWIRFAGVIELHNLLGQPIVDLDYRTVRATIVYAASEELALAPQPIAEPVCGGADEPIELDGLYLGLAPGRHVVVSGERADIGDIEGVSGAEPAMIAAVAHDVRAVGGGVVPWTHKPYFRNQGPPPKHPGDSVHTFIWLAKPLSYCYRRGAIAIHANVVKATHGETHAESLGSGDGARANQAFELKHSPLTHLAVPTPSGAADTLQLLVNDLRWSRAASFVDLPATARAYIVRTDHEGRSSLVFGDGAEGARLPTGTLNVAATYRSGLGRAGNVRAGQIQQLVTRPLGVKEVVNPLAAAGGADRETRDQARRNAPLATAALGRVVSPVDYADFARTFAGIAMADAVEISNGRRSVIHVTLAGLDDVPLEPASDLLAALRKAYRQLGDPFQPVRVAPRELWLLVVEARLRIDPDRRWQVVAGAVRQTLLEAFGFERRSLGQGVASSEVLSAIQSVEGVAMVDLDVFGAIPTRATGTDGESRPLTPEEIQESIEAAVAAGVASKVDARRARLEGGALLPAELLLLSPAVGATLILNQAGGEG
jgi:hypothetical protein